MSDPASKQSDYRAYEPQNRLQPSGKDIWIVDGPVLHWGYGGWKLPFPTRMTVVRLASGDLWLHSPTKPDEILLADIDALGPVTHLVSPNAIHHVSLDPWSKRYPNARVWASPGVRKRSSVSFSDDLGDEPPPEWEGDIDQRIARGSFAMEEVVFFHKASKTLILADLIENYEMDRLKGRFNRFLVRLAGVHKAKAPVDFRLSFLGGKHRFRPVVEWMLACQPERIIIAHGKWIEKGGVAALHRAFDWAL